MFDYLIKNGSLIDGTGAPARQADVAIKDGVIAAVGKDANGAAKETIDADGAIVTPAWIDIHTHYDGQVTWDSVIDPSFSHGVGTIVMGNCGVGFAPVKPNGHQDLIDLMEGVEDIPGTALYEGMPWGDWESYPEYLDFLAGRDYGLNISSQLAHGAVRNYVMGERGRNNEAASAEDLVAMGKIVEEGLRAGAVGFSTSRILGHRSIQGDPVPGTFANDDEVMCFAQALKRAGSGLFQIIPSSTLGESIGGELEHSSLEEELDLICRVSRESGRPSTFTLLQIDSWSDKWRQALAQVKTGNAKGAQVFPQVGSRPTGLVLSLDTYHFFMLRPTYRELRSLPLAARAAAMRKPEVKAAILAEANDATAAPPGSMEFLLSFAKPNYAQMFVLDENATYEPEASESFESKAKAQAKGKDVNGQLSYFYDYLVAGDGDQFAILFFTNYSDYNLDAIHTMQTDDSTVIGLSDGGAHVSLIFDAVNPTYQLTYWARDRVRGDKLPLEYVVHRQTQRNAELFGFHDRGNIEVGKKADVNVIDYDGLKLGKVFVQRDLPAGGARLMQHAKGYEATFVNGVMTRRNDADTGARPGYLLRGGA